jgi:hypothetical protein
MKKYLLAMAIIAVALFLAWGHFTATNDPPGASPLDNEAISIAFKAHRSGVRVTGEGVVTKVLPDDNDGSRHQRFVVGLESRQTLLVVHNIDLAPRLTRLESGDSVAFSGVYEWNPKGGLIHWTHHDPSGEHQPGWLRHNGEVSQ